MAADHKFEIKTPMKLAGKFGAPRVCPDPSPALRGRTGARGDVRRIETSTS
jgi:hypothetical protein